MGHKLKQFSEYIKKHTRAVFFIVVVFLLLLLTVRGDTGQPLAYQFDKSTAVGGPFESSNSTARYALTEAIVERRSLSLTDEEARFASPDIVFYHNHFYSIFMPGISFIGVPFYMLGKLFNVPQVSTYLSMIFFAACNMFLLYVIGRRLGLSTYAAILGGFTFLFATDALPYAQSYTQHHVTTTLLLLAILNAIGKRTVKKNILFGFIIGAAMLIDIPNIVLLVPVGLYILAQHLTRKATPNGFVVSFQLIIVGIIFGLLPFIAIFGWYNKTTTGSYVKTGQTLGRVTYEDIKINPPKAINGKVSGEDHNSVFPFQSRLLYQGMYILLVSDERSWIYYSPIVLVGLLGFYYLYKNRITLGFVNMLAAIIGSNILLYSMFGDPWGGWSFGPRYIIPSAAVLCITLAVAINAYGKKLLFSLLFLVLLVYSIFVSTVGAITTSAIPPKGEADSLANPLPHTYVYNIQLLQDNKLNSLIYNVFLRQEIPGTVYALIIFAALIIISLVLYARLINQMKKEAQTYAY